ncbi:MAG TPA: recombinase family protein [Paraburkholderia sp.]|uniref:recombinase family protein n=1 Tax=Paraburkholderia sp. TaxID=1926495 RepID=UPI002ED688C5
MHAIFGTITSLVFDCAFLFDKPRLDGLSPTSIARRMNDFGLRNRSGGTWLPRNVLQILRNERYIGTNIYSRTSSKPDAAWEQLPEAEWIRVPNAFEAIVSKHVFAAVQRKLDSARKRPTRDEIVKGLRKVVEKAGKLTQATLRHYRSAPSVERVMREFGSLNDAYREIGYSPNLNPERSENRYIERRTERSVVSVTTEMLEQLGHDIRFAKHTSVMCVDKTLRLQFVVRYRYKSSRCRALVDHILSLQSGAEGVPGGDSTVIWTMYAFIFASASSDARRKT